MSDKHTVCTLLVAFALVAFLSSGATGAEEDILILEGGRSLYGKILEETDEYVKIKCKYGVQTISKDNIREICRAAEFYDTFRRKRDKVEKKRNADEYYKLGLWCKKRKRKREANECFNSAVFINPNHEQARKTLGYKRHKGKWYTPDRYNEKVRGLVLHEGEWITKADKEKYDMGLIKYEGRWVTPEILEREEKRKATRRARTRKKGGKRKKITQKAPKIPLPQPYPKEDEWLKIQQDRYGWTTAIKTKRYYIFSTAPDQTTEYYGECMDALFEAYIRKFRYNGKQARRFTVAIFATYQEFLQKCRVGMGVGGFYSPGSRVLYVPNGLPPGTQMSTLNILAHEGHHQFQHFALGDMMARLVMGSIWIIEGGATYCEVAQFEKGKAAIGLVNPERLRSLKNFIQRGNYYKLGQLCRMSQRGFSKYHYDHAWGLLYFLMTKYQDKYIKFFFSFKSGEMGNNHSGTPSLPPMMGGYGGGIPMERRPGGMGGGGAAAANPMSKFQEIFGTPVEQIEEPWKQFVLALE